jgi:SAM-dependent methyltransferase
VDDSLRLQARAARLEIASGALRGVALRDAVLAVPFRDRDVWVDELLGIEPPPPDDELVDLGSGLGRVAILAHLLSGARTHGIEIQAPLVDRARARCAALGLTAVSFTHGDAAGAVLDGSVFFLYAPFNGDLLARVVRQLERVARRRPIALAAVGLELGDAAWLSARSAAGAAGAALTLYDSCVRG